MQVGIQPWYLDCAVAVQLRQRLLQDSVVLLAEERLLVVARQVVHGAQEDELEDIRVALVAYLAQRVVIAEQAVEHQVIHGSCTLVVSADLAACPS